MRKITYKWTLAVQTHVIQGSSVLFICWQYMREGQGLRVKGHGSWEVRGERLKCAAVVSGGVQAGSGDKVGLLCSTVCLRFIVKGFKVKYICAVT